MNKIITEWHDDLRRDPSRWILVGIMVFIAFWVTFIVCAGLTSGALALLEAHMDATGILALVATCGTLAIVVIAICVTNVYLTRFAAQVEQQKEREVRAHTHDMRALDLAEKQWKADHALKEQALAQQRELATDEIAQRVAARTLASVRMDPTTGRNL